LAGFYAEFVPPCNSQTQRANKGFAGAGYKYILFGVNLIAVRIACPSQKSGTKNHPTKHTANRVPMSAADAAFSCPFKVVASSPERAYRGGLTIVFLPILFTADPCFEGRT
jgi:hypothetical protein